MRSYEPKEANLDDPGAACLAYLLHISNPFAGVLGCPLDRVHPPKTQDNGTERREAMTEPETIKG
jgi:hypothetical protein